MTTAEIFVSLWLTFKLATITTLILILIGTPVAWWLARSKFWGHSFVNALIALPLVLPPTVLGFYFIVLFNPDFPVGAMVLKFTGTTLSFSFTGLVVASVVYSFPFVVQPLQVAFLSVPERLLEAGAVLGASALARFYSIVVPICSRAFITATVLGFAHTVGEFGVVLMIGGNIPGETRVLSIALFDEVEALNMDIAHGIAIGLIIFSLLSLTLVYSLNNRLQLIPSFNPEKKDKNE